MTNKHLHYLWCVVRYYSERGDAVDKASKEPHVVSITLCFVCVCVHACTCSLSLVYVLTILCILITQGRLQAAGAWAGPVPVLWAAHRGSGDPQHLCKLRHLMYHTSLSFIRCAQHPHNLTPKLNNLSQCEQVFTSTWRVVNGNQKPCYRANKLIEFIITNASPAPHIVPVFLCLMRLLSKKGCCRWWWWWMCMFDGSIAVHFLDVMQISVWNRQ